MKIAVVGSGIAGLSAAWLLSRQHQVTLYEKHSRPGMGAFNLDYEAPGGLVRIDMPLRAFNPCHYRNLVPFYEFLGIELQRTDHSAAYSETGADRPYFAYRYWEVGDYAIPRLASLKELHWQSAQVVAELTRFLLLARRDVASGNCEEQSIGDYLQSKRYGKAFAERILLPSFAAIATCSLSAIRQYPARDIIAFLANGMLFNGIWRVRRGVDSAIEKLTAPCEEVLCDRGVIALREKTTPGKLSAQIEIKDSTGHWQTFDHVVLATQANQAAELLSQLPDEHQCSELLKAVPYERSEVVVHSDSSLAPGFGPKAPPVLFEIDTSTDAPMASIHLNALYPELKEAPPLFQTWNPLREPEAGTVAGRAHFERPLVTLKSRAALAELEAISDQAGRQLSIVGSYVTKGIPLLESALCSSIRVAQKLGVNSPWPTTLE